MTFDLSGLAEAVPHASALLEKGGSAASGPKSSSNATPKVKLSRIAELILASDARSVALRPEDEAESRLNGRKRLGAGLGCTAEDLEEIAAEYGEEWESIVLEERVRLGIDSVAMRGATWDKLEGAALRKLMTLVETSKVTEPMELLAIAKAANAANRTGRANVTRSDGTPSAGAAGAGHMTNITQVAFGFTPGDPANGVLPNGNLGTIQLKLAHRVQKQMEQPTEAETELIGDSQFDSGRTLDNIEMLNLEQVQDAVRVIETGEEDKKNK